MGAFDSAHIFVLESNSEDHTREIVRNWKLNPPDCENVHTNLLNDLPNRIKKKLKHINDQKKAKLNITTSQINDDIHPEFGDHRIFHKGGKLIIKPIQPSREFEEIEALKHRKETEG